MVFFFSQWQNLISMEFDGAWRYIDWHPVVMLDPAAGRRSNLTRQTHTEVIRGTFVLTVEKGQLCFVSQAGRAGC